MASRSSLRSRGSTGRDGLVPQLYAKALRLLPPPILAEDGEEIAATFRELWRDGRDRRVELAVRAFGRLPWVVLREWMEFIGVIRAPGARRTHGRWGMTAWAGNVRQALRTLRKAPAFTTTTVVLLGLGIGSVTTIFALVDHVLLRWNKR